MKIKLWQFEYKFDNNDAKIVIPIILTTLGLIFTNLNKNNIWILSVIYYIIYFFFIKTLNSIKILRDIVLFRCPHCKSHAVFLQGYQGYHSDEHYAFYLCNDCRGTSVLINDRLIKAER